MRTASLIAHLTSTLGAESHEWAPFASSSITDNLMEVTTEEDDSGCEADDACDRPQAVAALKSSGHGGRRHCR